MGPNSNWKSLTIRRETFSDGHKNVSSSSRRLFEATLIPGCGLIGGGKHARWKSGEGGFIKRG